MLFFFHPQKKKFEILSEGSPEYRRFTYFAQTEDLAKNLLCICRMTHHFHMANQNRVADLKKLELDGKFQNKKIKSFCLFDASCKTTMFCDFIFHCWSTFLAFVLTLVINFTLEKFCILSWKYVIRKYNNQCS